MTEEQETWISDRQKEFKQLWGLQIDISIQIPDKLVQCIIDSCCNHYGITIEQIQAQDRHQDIARVRQMITLLCDQYNVSSTQWSVAVDRDRGSRGSCLRTATKYYRRNKVYREEYEGVKIAFENQWKQLNK